MRKFLKRNAGTAALEFAIVAPFFLLLTIAGLEFSLLTFSNALLEGGVREAARYGITGLDPENGDRETKIAEIINEHALSLFAIEPEDITTYVYNNFEDIGEPEPHTDLAGGTPEVYDEGEPFIDINCNGSWDEDQGLSGAGGGEEVVLYTVRQKYLTVTGVIDPLIRTSDGSDYHMEVSVAVRNEPFPGGGTLCDDEIS